MTSGCNGPDPSSGPLCILHCTSPSHWVEAWLSLGDNAQLQSHGFSLPLWARVGAEDLSCTQIPLPHLRGGRRVPSPPPPPPRGWAGLVCYSSETPGPAVGLPGPPAAVAPGQGDGFPVPPAALVLWPRPGRFLRVAGTGPPQLALGEGRF